MSSRNVDKREKILAMEEGALVIQQTSFRSYAVSYTVSYVVSYTVSYAVSQAVSSWRNLVLEGKEYLPT